MLAPIEVCQLSGYALSTQHVDVKFFSYCLERDSFLMGPDVYRPKNLEPSRSMRKRNLDSMRRAFNKDFLAFAPIETGLQKFMTWSEIIAPKQGNLKMSKSFRLAVLGVKFIQGSLNDSSKGSNNYQ